MGYVLCRGPVLPDALDFPVRYGHKIPVVLSRRKRRRSQPATFARFKPMVSSRREVLQNLRACIPPRGGSLIADFDQCDGSGLARQQLFPAFQDIEFCTFHVQLEKIHALNPFAR